MSNTPRTTEPTQVRHPWRAVARTVVQVLITFGTLIPVLIPAIEGDHPGMLGVAGVQALTVAGVVTRVMAIPAVNDLLTKIGLGATPHVEGDDQGGVVLHPGEYVIDGRSVERAQIKKLPNGTYGVVVEREADQ